MFVFYLGLLNSLQIEYNYIFNITIDFYYYTALVRVQQMNLIDESVKLEREEFVAGHNGTTAREILAIISVGPGLVLLHALFSNLVANKSLKARYAYDFTLLVLPLIFLITIFSNFIFHIALFLYSFSGFVVVKHLKSSTSVKCNILLLPVSSHRIPLISSMIYLVHVLTMISILAVDFKVFPRKFAKTESFGCSLMDLGVGVFVFVNGLISTQARNSENNFKSKKIFLSAFSSSLPLIILGLLRFASIYSTGYQQHISEYGVHWNFFFTLAVVKIFSSVFVCFFAVTSKTVFAYNLVLMSVYQCVLSFQDQSLTKLILSNDKRDNIFLQNKEGLSSSFGFLCIYFMGVSFGILVFKKKQVLQDWISVLKNLFLYCLVSWLAYYLCKLYVQDTSRRIANATYVLWIVSQCTFLMALFLTVDILIVYLSQKSKLKVLNIWCVSKINENKDNTKLFLTNFSLKSAINRNQLFLFLLSNVLTGFVNFSVDTINTSDATSVLILITYCAVVLSVTCLLHTKRKTIKFW